MGERERKGEREREKEESVNQSVNIFEIDGLRDARC